MFSMSTKLTQGLEKEDEMMVRMTMTMMKDVF